jgi:hypothetical protein
MANEGTVKLNLSFTKSGVSISLDSESVNFDVAGTNVIHNVQTIGTSEEAILLGDAGAGGYLFLMNRDSTNYIEIRQASGASDFCRLLAGEPACFRLSPDATAPYAIADTGSCDLEVMLIEL